MRFLLLLSVIALSSCGPSNYDQCVLENLSPEMNEEAVWAVQSACRNEFPSAAEPQPESTPVPESELSLISGRGAGKYGFFEGNLYNGTQHQLAEVTFQIGTTQSGTPDWREYSEPVSIAPKTTEEFIFRYVEGDQGTETSWSISGARYLD